MLLAEKKIYACESLQRTGEIIGYPLGLELHAVVSSLIWLTKLRPSARAARALKS